MARKKSSKARTSLKDRIKVRNREKATERKGSNALQLPNGVSILEVKKGTYLLDVIPYEVKVTNNPIVKAGEDWYERTYFRHNSIGAENKSVVCPLKTIKKPCPICEHRAILMQNYDDNEEQIKASRPSERQIFNVLDIENGKGGVQILDMSHYCFGEALETELSEDEDMGCFPDLVGGLTLKIRFKEEAIGKNTFPMVSRIDFDDRDDYDDTIMDDATDLDSVLNILTYKQLEALFFETGGNEEEEEEEEKPSRSSRRSRKDPDPEPEEEEEEKPSRSSRRSRKDPDPEPEEEECPKGHVYGAGCDSSNDCIECNVWEDCKDAQEALEKQDKTSKTRLR